MSRSGKRPIPVPKGVEVKIEGSKVAAKGPKGTFAVELPRGIKAELIEGELAISSESEGREMRRFHGLGRALAANVVVGAATGFVKKLELVGVGFRAAVKGNQLDLQLGFSHPTLVEIPTGISVKVEENVRILIEGGDYQRVGQFAATVRSLRPPEPYKGKGIRYSNEYVRRKAGKTGK
ncbi:MAG: 50S ribosomal protein L6 [Verrucomicrobia bacterium]|nr:50S ribosomal protein L6 [Verrucomicrobiota bacterium]